MARRSYSRGASRSRGRSYGSRGSTGRRSYSRPAPRRTRPVTRRASRPRSQTIRIEVVQPSENTLARPQIGLKPADTPRKKMF